MYPMKTSLRMQAVHRGEATSFGRRQFLKRELAVSYH